MDKVWAGKQGVETKRARRVLNASDEGAGSTSTQVDYSDLFMAMVGTAEVTSGLSLSADKAENLRACARDVNWSTVAPASQKHGFPSNHFVPAIRIPLFVWSLPRVHVLCRRANFIACV